MAGKPFTLIGVGLVVAGVLAVMVWRENSR
jgi:hypothetical protein